MHACSINYIITTINFGIDNDVSAVTSPLHSGDSSRKTGKKKSKTKWSTGESERTNNRLSQNRAPRQAIWQCKGNSKNSKHTTPKVSESHKKKSMKEQQTEKDNGKRDPQELKRQTEKDNGKRELQQETLVQWQLQCSHCQALRFPNDNLNCTME